GALLGVPAAVAGTLSNWPADVLAGNGDQAGALRPRLGVPERWLQDSARVRASAQSLVDSLLRDDLAGATRVGLWATQTPAAPYDARVDAASVHRWVGSPFPGPLG